MNKRLAAYPASDALKRLRFCVLLACSMVSLAIITHLLTWAFTSFTDVRYMRIQAEAGARNPVVVVQGVEKGRDSSEASGQSAKRGKPGGAREEHLQGGRMQTLPDPVPIDVNRVISSNDIVLRSSHQIMLAIGIIGLGLLLVETSLGVVVSGGAGIPAVGRVVNAQLWSVLLLGLALPWHRLVNELPYNGLFPSYPSMVETTEAYRQGIEGAIPPIVFYGRFLVFPVVAVGIVTLIGWSFVVGVAGGIISKKPSKFEIEIEEEATGREAGTVVYGGRAGSALKQTIVDDDTPRARRATRTKPESTPAPVDGKAAPMKSPPANEPAIDHPTFVSSEADDEQSMVFAYQPADEDDLPNLRELAAEEPYRRPI